ncbi:hypothetical protein DER44DRAFT_812884 [Fusarium oxysporum]|nr:hypothetical protein DER44DRAFT_812884 [Fusarium oxysporum]
MVGVFVTRLCLHYYYHVSSKAFHKPLNHLVFYASCGTMLTNVGTLMSRHYISSPESETLIRTRFMPADAFWSLSMANNIPYLIGCYSVPFVPDFVYSFIKNKGSFVIAVNFFMYIRAGNMIYQKRRELDDSSTTDRHLTYGGDNIGIIKTTEVSVPSEAMTPNAIHLQPMSRQATDPSDPNSNGNYLVHISAHSNSRDIADKGVPIERQQTRVPSSANRIYSVLNTNSMFIPIGNALIYMGQRPHLTELMDGMAPDIGGNHHPRRHNLPHFRANTTSNKFETGND